MGKTTLTACLARLLSERGVKVLAADEDPQMNLPYALGLPLDKAAASVPLIATTITSRRRPAYGRAKSFGSMFRLNPRVDDVVKRFWRAGR
ncbi:MAG: AAA family ATPase [Syntrophotaleaceae bacterium]